MINFSVALRVVDFASGPLKRAATAGDLMSASANRLSVAAKAANSALMSFTVGVATVSTSMSAAAAQVEERLARLATATETTTTTMDTALFNAEVAARNFSTNYSASVEQILAAQFRLATAGVAVSEQIAAVQGSYKFAAATAGDFLTASELVGSFLNTFGRSIELNYLTPAAKVAKITDVMSAAVQKYQLDMNNLNDSLKFLVGPASTLGLSIAEVTAFAGALNTAGFRGTLAGTAISNAFNKIDIATEKLDLDRSAFTDASGNLKSWASFLDEVERKMANMTSIEKQSKYIQVFDIRAGRAIGTMIDLKDNVVAFANEMDIATGVTDKLANIMEQTTTAKFKQFINSIVNVASAIGGPMNEGLKVIMDGVKMVAIAIESFVTNNKVLVAGITLSITTITVLSAAFVSISLIIGKFSGALLGLGKAGGVAGSIAVGFVALYTIIGKVTIIASTLLAAFYAIESAISLWKDAFDITLSSGDRFLALLGAIGLAVGGVGLAIIGIGKSFNLIKPIFTSIADLITRIRNFRLPPGLSTDLQGPAAANVSPFSKSLVRETQVFKTALRDIAVLSAAAITAIGGLVLSYNLWTNALDESASTTEKVLYGTAALITTIPSLAMTIMVVKDSIGVMKNVIGALLRTYLTWQGYNVATSASLKWVKWATDVAARSIASLALSIGGVILAASSYKNAMDENLSSGERFINGAVAIIATLSIIGVNWFTLGEIASRAASTIAAAVANIILSLTGMKTVASSALLVLGAKIAIFAAAVAALVGTIYLVSESMKKVENPTKRLITTQEEVDKKFRTSRDAIASYAAEIERLARITERNIAFRPTGMQNLGQLPVSQQATKALKNDPALSAKQALEKEVEAAGGMIALMRQIGTQIIKEQDRPFPFTEQVFDIEGFVRIASELDQIKMKTDSVYQSQDSLNKTYTILRQMNQGQTSMFKAVGDGTDNAVESMTILMSTIKALQATDVAPELSNAQARKFYQAINNGSDMMKNSALPALREFAFAAAELQGQLAAESAPTWQKWIGGWTGGELSESEIDKLLPTSKLMKRFLGIGEKIDIPDMGKVLPDAVNFDDPRWDALQNLREQIAATAGDYIKFQGVVYNLFERPISYPDVLVGTPSAKNLIGIAEMINKQIDDGIERTRQLAESFSNAEQRAQMLRGALTGIELPEAQVKTKVESIENLFRGATLGVTKFRDVIPDAKKRLEDARKTLSNFDQGVAVAKSMFDLVESLPDSIRDAVKNTQEFKDLEIKLSTDVIADTKVKIAAAVDRASLAIAQDEFKYFLDQTQNDALIKIRDTLGTSFAGIFEDAISGKLTKRDMFARMGEDIKSMLTDSVKQAIGFGMADQFKEEIDTVKRLFSNLATETLAGGRANINIDTDEFNRSLQNIINVHAPKLKQALDIDFTKNNEGLKKMAESYNDLIIDASIKSMTATSETSSLLREMNTVLQSGPINDYEEKIRQLTRLLTEADRLGASDAKSAIESALKVTMQQKSEATDQVGRLLNASQIVNNTVQTTASTLANAAEQFPNAAVRFVDIVTSGMREASSWFGGGLANISMGTDDLRKAIVQAGIDTSVGMNTATPEQMPTYQALASALSVSGDSQIMAVFNQIKAIHEQAVTKNFGEIVTITSNVLREMLDSMIKLQATAPTLGAPQATATAIQPPAGTGTVLENAIAGTGSALISGITVNAASAQALADTSASIASASTSLQQSTTAMTRLIDAVTSPTEVLVSATRGLIDALTSAAKGVVSNAPSTAEDMKMMISTMMSEIMRQRAKDELPSGVVSRTEVPGTDQAINVRIDGKREIVVNMTDSSGTSMSASRRLTDSEIKGIIERTRRELTDENNEALRRIESELRRLRSR